MKKISIKGLWGALKQSFKGFSDDKVPKLSASLSYYTVFSLGPLMIVIIALASIFWGREAIEGSIYTQMKGFVGNDAATQMQSIIKNATISGKGPMAAVIGIITLLIGATSVFGEIQDSINGIWGLKPKPKAGWIRLVMNRVLSFGVIASLGFLLLVSLAVTALVEALNHKLQSVFPDVTVVLFYIINLIITLGVVTLLFAVIFKVLPDADIKWKDVWAGSITTALLFLIGKFGIALYVSKSSIGTTYGAAGSLVVLLVWIYYSSIILYFGAEFTKAYAVNFGSEIHPNQYAVTTETVEVEHGKQSIQQKEAAPAQKETKPEAAPPKEVKETETSIEHKRQVYRYGAPQQEPLKAHVAEKKKTDLMTTAVGLLLFFVSKSNDKKNEIRHL